jgi:hypothetical protein
MGADTFAGMDGLRRGGLGGRMRSFGSGMTMEPPHLRPIRYSLPRTEFRDTPPSAADMRDADSPALHIVLSASTRSSVHALSVIEHSFFNRRHGHQQVSAV